MIRTLSGLRLRPGGSWQAFWRRKKEVYTEMKVMPWPNLWAERGASWHCHLERRKGNLASQLLEIAHVQVEKNAILRTAGMLSSRPSALGTRRVIGAPCRTMERLRKLATTWRTLKSPRWLMEGGGEAAADGAEAVILIESD
jgi:hypothetical protein